MEFKLIGLPCGQQGPYTFYKAFKYSKNGKTKILALSEFFFVKLWNDSDLVTIGEMKLLWVDKNSEQTLASLRLYILPENTPEGRSDCHGEHEVLAVSEKVVLRVEDLLTWVTEPADWSWGLAGVYSQDAKLLPRPSLLSDNSHIDLSDVDKEKDLLGESQSGVVVVSFPRYCRYRGVLKRLEGVQDRWLREALVLALGGLSVPCPNTRVLFCKDTFDYPDLEGHELLCNHLAPKLKGKPRKKRKQLDTSPDSSDSDSSSGSSSSSSAKEKVWSTARVQPQVKVGLSIQGPGLSRRVGRPPQGSSEQREFITRLHAFMRSRQTPISRVPTIGFKELDLYKLWWKVRQLGGYDAVTSSRLWKYVYEEMGGDQGSTSAATCCRRHYERLLLPYERYVTPSRSKNPVLAKLKKFEEISITTKSTHQQNDKSKSLLVRDIGLRGKIVKTPRNKENTPSSTHPVAIIDLSRDDSPVKVKDTDIIDLVSESDESPVKARPAVNPVMKKQKLQILKEGGLEVTAVPGVANGRPAAVEIKPRPSVIQRPVVPSSGGKEKVSITITPDVRHMLPIPRDRTNDEILDLRTKAGVGSNLEITLVPPVKKPQLTVPMPHRQPVNQPQKLYQQQFSSAMSLHKPAIKIPTPSATNGRTNIVPSVSISVNHQKKKSKPTGPSQSHGSQTFPYSMMDPVYLSAFYSGLFSPYSATSSPQQVQLYKELVHRHNIPDSFPRLLQDGSTSISLVNQTSTPPPK